MCGKQEVNWSNQDNNKKLLFLILVAHLPANHGAPIGERRVPRHKYAYGGTNRAPSQGETRSQSAEFDLATPFGKATAGG